MAKKYYAYLIVNGNVKGISESWEECKNIVSGTQARYKGFTSRSEADKWLEEGASYEVKEKPTSKKNTTIEEGIYFDAGKRGQNGVTYARVTNEKAEDLADMIFQSEVGFAKTISALNCLDTRRKVCNYNGCQVVGLNTSSSNNTGELLAFIIATDIALYNVSNGQKPSVILGDSKLVLDYWSKGNFKYNLPTRTKNAINIAIDLRKKAEAAGITYKHISGDVNPADLGFHKSK
ncbi:MAG: viroplasmin family protein [Sarcina sp.]